MWIESLVVFLWMLAVYAGVYKLHIKKSDDIARECRFIAVTACVGVMVASISANFNREMLWFSVATIAAVFIIIAYARTQQRRMKIIDAA